MACPLCRQIFIIPREGFEELDSDPLVDEIQKSLMLTTHEFDSSVLCSVCLKEEFTKFCVDCAQDMCDTCSVMHIRLRACMVHTIVWQEEKQNSIVLMQARTTYCDTHKAEQLTLYCHDCHLAICFACSRNEHNTHKFEYIEEFSRNFLSKIQERRP